MHSLPAKIKILLILAKSCWKIEIKSFPLFHFYMITRLCLKYFVNDCRYLELLLRQHVCINFVGQVIRNTQKHELTEHVSNVPIGSLAYFLECHMCIFLYFWQPFFYHGQYWVGPFQILMPSIIITRLLKPVDVGNASV